MSSLEDRKKSKAGVPFYSQHRECFGEELVGNIACAPTCFKMCLEFFRIFPKMSVLEMYKYGLLMKGKTGAGFKHDFIVEEFKRAGLIVDRFDKYGEYKREESEINKIKIELEFIDAIKKCLDNKGVIMNSEYMPRKSENKDEETRGSHFCVITNYSIDENGDLDGFYLNDPNFKFENEGKNRWYSLNDFLLNSRKLAIIINNY